MIGDSVPLLYEFSVNAFCYRYRITLVYIYISNIAEASRPSESAKYRGR